MCVLTYTTMHIYTDCIVFGKRPAGNCLGSLVLSPLLIKEIFSYITTLVRKWVVQADKLVRAPLFWFLICKMRPKFRILTLYLSAVLRRLLTA